MGYASSCRICLNPGATVSIFQNKAGDISICSKINLCLGEKIEDIPGYPRCICRRCYLVVNDAFALKNQCRETCILLEKSLNIKQKCIEIEPDISGTDIEKNKENTSKAKAITFNDANQFEECVKPLLKVKRKTANSNGKPAKAKICKSNTGERKLSSSVIVEDNFLSTEENLISTENQQSEESSDSSSEESCNSIWPTPPDIQKEADSVIENLLPSKSKEKYLLAHEKFVQWKIDKKSNSWSEKVFLDYFSDLSKEMKPSSLWTIYFMLKSTVAMKHNVNIKDYHTLTRMLKRQSDGYKCDKSKVFTRQNVEMFLHEAPDSKYLTMKVVLLFGIYGGCCSREITNITVNDVETHNNIMTISIRDTNTKKHRNRTFIISGNPFAIAQKYKSLRPADVKTNRFFLSYRNLKCRNQVVGLNTISQMPKKIAKYLKLPNPEKYTGHCFRRSSAVLLADIEANPITKSKSISNSKSKSEKVTESCIEQSVENNNRTGKSMKSEQLTFREASKSIKESIGCTEEHMEKSIEDKTTIANQISQNIKLEQPTTFHEASTSAEDTIVCIEKYIEESIQDKSMIANQISKSIKLERPTFYEASDEGPVISTVSLDDADTAAHLTVFPGGWKAESCLKEPDEDKSIIAKHK